MSVPVKAALEVDADVGIVDGVSVAGSGTMTLMAAVVEPVVPLLGEDAWVQDVMEIMVIMDTESMNL